MRIKKGDKVLIIKGKDRGKSGVITNVLPKSDKVIIEGLNLIKKQVRPRKQGEKGQIVHIPRPIIIPNIMLVCKSCGKPTRIGYGKEGKRKFRVCKQCNGEI